jgi:hypothetical protein
LSFLLHLDADREPAEACREAIELRLRRRSGRRFGPREVTDDELPLLDGGRHTARMNATAIPVRPPRSSTIAAARGALVGVVVLAVWLLAYRLADFSLSADPYPRGTEDKFGLAVLISLPASLAVALLTAGAARLRRPWLLGLIGIVLAPIVGMLIGTVVASALTETAGLVAIVLTVVATYAALATFSGPTTRP